jgi:hypothetical protein
MFNGESTFSVRAVMTWNCEQTSMEMAALTSLYKGLMSGIGNVSKTGVQALKKM